LRKATQRKVGGESIHMDASNLRPVSPMHRGMDPFYFDLQDLNLFTPRPSHDVSTLLVPPLPNDDHIPYLGTTPQFEANNGLVNRQVSRDSSDIPAQSPVMHIGSRKRKAPTLRDVDWEPVKRRIIELHITQNISLPDVKERVKKEFGFEATYVSLTSRATS
jgi:hypothetical protein